jgi:hypothetical protein
MEFTGNLPGPTLAGATRGGRSGPRLATRGQSSPAVRNKWKIEENTDGGERLAAQCLSSPGARDHGWQQRNVE